ncbi:LysR substrate-binding domain-containing protein [Rhizobium sp. S152]|uniref:LysR family transcriptional regulator n=1 Tax=Rhizobium sp. S152 TaxID=3055038 RepID=UPI0025A963B3|nr:LysR family transcriptional regulator [Rhizobium sp. S152]MDM9628519.1 LysR substrate-binding domain-containing protein [Rhizobium sp. S152]
MDQLTAMRVFVRVVETGNFTRASETLAVPKATVTTLVQGLEGHLRTKLLHRTTRQVNVTTDGALYYERAVRILSEIDELDAGLSNSQGRPSGRLRVEMAGALSDTVIIPALESFYTQYPDIQLDIGVSDRSVDYIVENVDCAIRAGTPTDQSMIARLVGQVSFVNCASPGYLEKHGDPQSVTDLEANHRLVAYLQAPSGQISRFQGQENGQLMDFAPRHIVSASDTRSCLAAALEGHGVFQAPEILARSYLAGGQLREVLPGWKRDPLSLYVVYPPNRHLSNKVRVFVDWVVGVLAGRVVGR